MAIMRYCLECGYSRQGLPKDAVCPECGEADSFDKQREVCAALASKPLSLLWRVMTLRRLPKGWWVVFEDKPPSSFKPWQIFLFGILILLVFCTLGSFIWVETKTTKFVYDINDPLRSLIAEDSEVTEKHNMAYAGSTYETSFALVNPPLVGPFGYKRSTQFVFDSDLSEIDQEWAFIGYLLTYTTMAWLLCRFVWLKLIARDRCAQAFLNAARQTTVIYLAQVLWLIITSLSEFFAIFLTSLVSTIDLNWISMPFSMLRFAVLISGAAIIWWRVISADSIRYVFPRRIRAVLLLITIILSSYGVFTWPWFW